MKNDLILDLQPVKVTKEIMIDLEQKGLIIRIAPGSRKLIVPEGQAVDETIYESDKKYGSHKLIYVVISNVDFDPHIGIHSDNEEFLIIGENGTRPLFLLICYLTAQQFKKAVEANSLSSDDLILLEMEYNNPETSFFVMKKAVIHGEATIAGNAVPPSFFVTEPSELDHQTMNFGEYKLKIIRQ